MALVMFDYKSNPSKYVYMSPVFGTNKYMLEMERHKQIVKA